MTRDFTISNAAKHGQVFERQQSLGMRDLKWESRAPKMESWTGAILNCVIAISACALMLAVLFGGW